jgi:polysaccharide biosynthesis protein PslG
LLVVVLIVGIVVARGQVRHDVADLLGVRVKNDVLAVSTLLLAPPVETDDLAPIREDGLPPYAVNVFLDQEVQTANVVRSLDLIQAAGFRFIKQELLWSDVERPQKGAFEDAAVAGKSAWDKYDRIVDLAQQRGIQVIFRIDTSPAWARPGTTKIETPPENLDDYGDFVAAVVQRYKGRVRYYQFWNEPNWEFEWGGRVATPAEYTQMLRIAYARAKAVDPSVVILAAPLAPTIENSDRATSDVAFLQGMYDAGARPYFDVMSANAYGLRNGPDDFRFNREDDVNFARPVLMREIMVRNGDADKAIWASEIGWNALPADWGQTHPGEQPIWGSVSRDLQAAYTVRGYQRAAEQWPWMDVMAVWHFRMVYPQNQQSQQYYFDLVSLDWQVEPVYLALQNLMTAPPILHRGYHQEDHWALTWGPGWQRLSDPRASLGQLATSTTPGARLDFDLDASWLDLVTPTGPGWGQVAVTIDGNPMAANRLPIVRGQAVLDLAAAPDGWQVRQPIADGLGPGVHHVQVRVLDGRVGLDGIVADRESPRDVLLWQVTGTLIGLGFLGIRVWMRRGRAPLPLPPPPQRGEGTNERAHAGFDVHATRAAGSRNPAGPAHEAPPSLVGEGAGGGGRPLPVPQYPTPDTRHP